jgi:membrane protease YdiL (CAAX protease family)
MVVALAVAGGLAESVAWLLVARRGRSVWLLVTTVLAVAGLAALLTGRVAASPRVDPLRAALAGAGVGVALHLATRAFVAVAGRVWSAFRRHTAAIYELQGGRTLLSALALAMVAVAGEELFWRGLVQGLLEAEAGRVSGAVASWAVYVAANLPSMNLAIVAGAVVGGAVWGALALWTGGVLACLVSHAVWTGLMIAFPFGRPATARVAP